MHANVKFSCQRLYIKMLTPTFSRLVPVISKYGASRSQNARSIMVRYYKGARSSKPTVIFVPGFMSHGKGLKAIHLASHCRAKGYNYLCYDPEGLADSPCNFKTLEFSDWFDDCHTAIEVAKQQCNNDGPVVLVGSSMGGWISLKLGQDQSGLASALLLVAPSINFLWKKYLMWYNACSQTNQQKLDSGECLTVGSDYGDMIIRKGFAEGSRHMEIDTTKPIDLNCPIRIIHGVEDEVVPFDDSLKLMKSIKSEDIDVLLRKSGKHRLSEPEDLKLISVTLDQLVERLTVA